MENSTTLEEITEQVMTWIHLGYTLTDCAHAFNVHRTTMWRWLRNIDAWKGVYSKFTVPEVCWIITNTISIEEHAVTLGIRFDHDHLRRLGYRISRTIIREALQVLMLEVLQHRYQGCLVRREYDIYLPMHVWHMDSHDKLARWGFRIHGAIDGASHYIVYLIMCLDKKAPTIFQAYKGAVQKFGHPLLIRSDYAAEHSLVEANILRAQPNTNPFRAGPFVHNQRIEAFWRILREKMTGYYQRALHVLSFEEGSLQIDNPLHRWSLVSVFLPILQAAMANFIATWNGHKVRAINERGRCRPAHIPQIAFQAADREAGLVLPPPYPVGADLTMDHVVDDRGPGNPTNYVHQASFDTWNHNNDAGCFEEGMEDLTDEFHEKRTL